jgi:hypothetical protein
MKFRHFLMPQDDRIALRPTPATMVANQKFAEDPMSSLASKQGPRYRHTADEAEPYETIGVEKLTPIIGAEISGVDLSASLSNRTMDEIHRALAENLVIFFRDQHITPQQHRAPVRRTAHPSRRTP